MNSLPKLRSWGLSLFVLFEHRLFLSFQALAFLRTKFICIIWTYLEYLNQIRLFLRTKFICIIWTARFLFQHLEQFLRTKFICIIWTERQYRLSPGGFLRTKFICIIWTHDRACHGSELFLRTKFICIIWTGVCWMNNIIGSWGLSLFVLFERKCKLCVNRWVLED